MLPAARTGGRVISNLRSRRVYAFSSSSAILTSHPNPPLNLDPSLQVLLKDVDISLSHHRARLPPPPKELEATPIAQGEEESLGDAEDQFTQRKSPAADFGSQQIGAVVIPAELQNSINALISESDRAQLHNDAKRLFYDAKAEEGLESKWETTYASKYRSWRQKAYHAERDGTAFASVALPAHYSAIVSVLDHVKRRLEPSWKIEQIIDWGAGTGSGLWAGLYLFQSNKNSGNDIPIQDRKLSDSTVASYLGIDKREGLVAIGKRLIHNIDLGNLSISWQKSFKDDDRIRRSDGHGVLALSAFMLTTLPTPQARRLLVKEMWESGAHVMVLIDHNTTAGFEAIAESRKYLIEMGQKEFEDVEANDWPIRGSHVVAPCPHDGACPLYHPGLSRLVCGFSQRIQRPAFVRRTKHSNVGHEDIGYSYVVVRRGPRPSTAVTTFGRIGDIGKRALDKTALSQIPMRELILHNDNEPVSGTTEEASTPILESITTSATAENEPRSRAELLEALRLEAYSWPRLVFPPLKKSGHIILDSCTAEGKIMRLTIPKSQGRQAYYDARKSSWGDIFPHSPKNQPQERSRLLRSKHKAGTMPAAGADIGKRRRLDRKREKVGYKDLAKNINQKKKDSRRDRVRDLRLE